MQMPSSAFVANVNPRSDMRQMRWADHLDRRVRAGHRHALDVVDRRVDPPGTEDGPDAQARNLQPRRAPAALRRAVPHVRTASSRRTEIRRAVRLGCLLTRFRRAPPSPAPSRCRVRGIWLAAEPAALGDMGRRLTGRVLHLGHRGLCRIPQVCDHVLAGAPDFLRRRWRPSLADWPAPARSQDRGRRLATNTPAAERDETCGQRVAAHTLRVAEHGSSVMSPATSDVVPSRLRARCADHARGVLSTIEQRPGLSLSPRASRSRLTSARLARTSSFN